jgi:molecular chaperone DnaK
MVCDRRKEVIIGIDLGTTNSEVALVQGGRPRVIEEGGSGIVPSAVALDLEGRLLVGEPALNQMLATPERGARSIKRKMGGSEKVRLGELEHTPQEISAIILRHLKERAERSLGVQVHKAVITVPAFFNDAQRQATRQAGELAGLEVVRILHEPTAAALVYEAESLAAGEGKRILVYDLGGGTFDVSVVEISAGVVEVRASHGDTHLGGDDFDQLLLDHVAERFREEKGLDLREIPRARARLLRSVERAKRALSVEPFVTLEEEFVAERDGEPLHLSMELSRPEYENMILPLVERSMASVQTALRDAGLLAHHIDEIILVGGATRTPLVQELLEERAGREPRFEVDPELCVALGAASQAALIAGEEARNVLVDITPHSLGIAYLGVLDEVVSANCYGRIIPKGTPLPASRSEVYFTARDGQERVRVRVYQGEARDVRENTKLGDFLVEGLRDVEAGNPILCSFHLTLDGTLEVEASEKATGLKRDIVIKNAINAFDEEERVEAEARLAKLFGEEKAALGGAAGAAPEGEVEDPHGVLSAVNRVEALLERMSPDDRKEADAWIHRARTGISEGRLDEAHKARDELRELLFYLEEA